jgi:hypothetical protein
MEEMSISPATPWYKKKPILVLVITYYCVFSFVFLCTFIFENWPLVQMGTITVPNFLTYCLPNTLLGIAGLLLFIRKKSSIYFFVAMLVVGTIRFMAVGVNPRDTLFTILPSIQGFALIFGIVLYCLHLKDENYFK